VRLTEPSRLLIEQNESLAVLKNRMLVREGKSEETLRRYLDGVKAFTEYIKAESPDAALKSVTDCEDRTLILDGFIDWLLAKDASPVNVKALWQGVKKWLVSNRVNNIEWSYVTRPKVVTQIRDRIPSTEELKIILTNKVSLRDRALFMTAATSGLRLGTLMLLKVRDYERVEDVGKITVEGGEGRKLAKGKSYFTFITPETRIVLEEYFSTRESLAPESPLFAKDNGEQMSQYVHNVSRQWLKLVKRAMLHGKIEGHRWSELHGHVLRKFFQTRCKLSGCRADFVDFWMGHHPAAQNQYLNDSYFRPELSEHLTEYRKAVSSLLIFNPDLEALEKAKGDIEALRQQNLDLKAKVDSIEGSKESLALLLQKVLELEKRLEEQKNT